MGSILLFSALKEAAHGVWQNASFTDSVREHQETRLEQEGDGNDR